MYKRNSAENEMPLIKVSEDMLIRGSKGEYGSGYIGYDINMFMDYCIRINHYILSENYKAALQMVEKRDNYLMEMTSCTRPLFVIVASLSDKAKNPGKICVSEFLENLRGLLLNMVPSDVENMLDNCSDMLGTDLLDIELSFCAGRKDFDSLSEFINNFLEEQTAESCRKAEDDYKKMLADSPTIAERAKDLALSIPESSLHNPSNFNNNHYEYSSALISSLRLPSGCRVFITHDHSSFKNGKNGFAITDKGIYLIEIMSSRVQHISYEELGDEEPDWKDSRFIIGNKRILFPCRQTDQSLIFNFLNVIGKYCRFINSSAK